MKYSLYFSQIRCDETHLRKLICWETHIYTHSNICFMNKTISYFMAKHSGGLTIFGDYEYSCCILYIR